MISLKPTIRPVEITMYRIYVNPSGYITLCEDAAPANAIHLPDAAALLQLRARINAYVDTLAPDDSPHDAPPDPGFITTTEAHALAQQRGITIPVTTLINALNNGAIPGSRKSPTRWLIPRSAFLTWLDRYRPDA